MSRGACVGGYAGDVTGLLTWWNEWPWRPRPGVTRLERGSLGQRLAPPPGSSGRISRSPRTLADRHRSEGRPSRPDEVFDGKVHVPGLDHLDVDRLA
jgi:hypothetical protein